MTRRRRSSPAETPPALENDDLLADIILRLPPQPSTLPRAASVCTRWRRLVSDPGFLRRFRARHRGKAPLLGVFMDRFGHPQFQSVLDPPDAVPAKRFPLWRNQDENWDLLGVRHGRVLVFNRTRHQFLVWDPATRDRRCVPVPPEFDGKQKIVFNGAVLCADGGQGHEHGDCHGSPFQVVLIGTNEMHTQAFASVYSSETGEWGHLVSTAIRHMCTTSSTLIGDSLYWLTDDIDEGGIIEFDLGRQSLSVIEVPQDWHNNPYSYNYHIILPEDGGVGLVISTHSTLDMWDRKVGSDGVGRWVQRKTVKLEEITGLSSSERGRVVIHGYDEDDNVIFLMTDIGCFMVQLESMKFRNLGKRDFVDTDFITTCAYHPYRSFYASKGFGLDYKLVWNDCIKTFEEQKAILLEVLNSADCKISLSADTLVSSETMGRMCLRCHFIDSDWKVQKRIIKFFAVELPHNGVEIFNAILKSIQDWNIEGKIFGITLSDSAANDTMADMLKHNLAHKKVLPVEGKLLRSHCAMHLINDIVNDALKLIDSTVDKIRKSVNYIQSSQSQEQKVKEIIAQDGISCEHWPSLDIPTDWKSTYWLLEEALECKRAFDSLALQDKNYTYAPSFEEWERVAVVFRLLKECYKATWIISDSSSCTSNLYFHEIWKIKLALDGDAFEVENDAQKMLKGIKTKFNKYWIESYVSLSIPVVLDPRFKYMFIEFRLKQSFGAEAGIRLERVQKVLRGLVDEYSPKLDDCSVDSTEEESDLEMDLTDNDPLADWYEYLSKNSQVLTELDRYLNESPIHKREDFDILNWWKVYSPMYPNLARIARDVLAMPVSTVASKWAFSTKERTISDSHSRLSTETIEAVICLQDWLRASGSDLGLSIIDFSDYYDISL